MSERRVQAPVCDQIDVVARDVLLTAPAKRERIMDMRGEGCLAALHALGLPHTIRRSTQRGELAITIATANHPLVDDVRRRNAVRLRVAVSLAGKPVAVDQDRIFVNPPLKEIAPVGDSETTVTEPDIDGVERTRTFRWREAPAAILIAELVRQVMAELRV